MTSPWSRKAFALLSVGLVAMPAFAAEPMRQLKGPEIRARFAGMEFTDEVDFSSVFNKDGTITTVAGGQRTKGRWRVEGDGLCLVRDGPDERCYDVWASGASVELRDQGIDVTEMGILQKPGAKP
jgi:hypothetical protein